MFEANIQWELVPPKWQVENKINMSLSYFFHMAYNMNIIVNLTKHSPYEGVFLCIPAKKIYLTN